MHTISVRSWIVGILAVAFLSAISNGSATAQAPDAFPALNKQVMALHAAGKYAEATEIAKRALTVAESSSGADHADTATPLDNLGLLHRLQGRFNDAEPLLTRALATRTKALGANHVDVATSHYNLGVLYRTRSRYSESDRHLKQALAIREKALGSESPAVAEVLADLTELRRLQGRYAAAWPLIRRSLAIREKALGPENPDVAHSLNFLAEMYLVEGQYAEAEPHYKRALAIREKALGVDHPDVGQSHNNLADNYRHQEQFAEAERHYMRAIDVRGKALGPDGYEFAESLNNLASLYVGLDRNDEAERLYMRAYAIWEKGTGPESIDVANSLGNLANLYDESRAAEAEAFRKRALAIQTKLLAPDHRDISGSYLALGQMYEGQKRYAEAEDHMKRAIAILERAVGREHNYTSDALNSLADLYFVQRNWARSAEYRRRGNGIIMRRVQRGSVAGAGKLTGKKKSESARSSEEFVDLVKTGYRLALQGKSAATSLAREMFEVAQWAQSSEAGASLAQMAARGVKGDPGLSRLVRERQDLVAEWQKLDAERTVAVSQAPESRDRAAETLNANRLGEIEKLIAAIDNRFKAEFPEFAALSRPEQLSVKQVQSDLRPDEALVLFLDAAKREPTPEETFVWVVTKTDVRWVRSKLGTKALNREVAALRCGLDASSWSKNSGKRCAALLKVSREQALQEDAALPFDHARAHKLYVALFGEVADLIKGKHLLLVPSGPLTQLPFQVLVTSPPSASTPAGDDNKKIAWLARAHALTVLPAVSSLKALRRVSKPSGATKPMLGVGNPLLDGKNPDPDDDFSPKKMAENEANQSCSALGSAIALPARHGNGAANPAGKSGAVVDQVDLKRQSPLPDTADEICNVANVLGAGVTQSDIFLGARGNEAEIKRLSEAGTLKSYRIVHFATHGLLAGELSTEPGLILSPPETASEEDDGFLSAGEIAGLKLDADWVILSACNSASGAEAEGETEALSGMARAFFYAGARAVLVSHWPVNSKTTVRLITGAFDAAAKDKSIGRAEALRRAMLAMIDGADAKHAHPAFWAPFVVAGEGGSAR